LPEKPQKRHPALHTLSSEHHHGLVFSSRIKIGISKNVDVKRICSYVNWFKNNYLFVHFDIEEKHVFPVLGGEHKHVITAVNDHIKIRRLLEGPDYSFKMLNELATLLISHIRFEERYLFPEIQEEATEDQLKYIENIHPNLNFIDNVTDTFWK